MGFKRCGMCFVCLKKHLAEWFILINKSIIISEEKNIDLKIVNKYIMLS